MPNGDTIGELMLEWEAARQEGANSRRSNSAPLARSTSTSCGP